jgi:hypothetical protein
MTPAQEVANQTLPQAVFADPLAFTRALALPDGWSATIERRGKGVYTTVIVTPPAPQESGDPAAVVIVGRGDGTTKLTTLGYYVLELVLGGEAPRFQVVSRTDRERVAVWADGPLPDPKWFADHAFDLYSGQTPQPRTGVPELPAWYWWHAFEGAAAVRAFDAANDDAERIELVRKYPVLLLPDLAPDNMRLRLVRARFRKDPDLAWGWEGLVQRLANNQIGSPAVNNLRLLPLVADARQGGGLTRVQAYELEGTLRSNLAALGVDYDDNRMLADEMFAAARAVVDERPRPSHGTGPPPMLLTEDPLWRPVFLDGADLPNHVPSAADEIITSSEPTFVGHGGLRAGYAIWTADESSAFARIVDARWVFRTENAAAAFMRAAVLGEGFPPHPAPQIGDETIGFGDDGSHGGRRAFVLVMRIGRLVAKVLAVEGQYAAASRQILHAAMLHPLAEKIVQRARQGISAYWLAVAYPTNAVPALVHTAGYNAAILLAKYPMLAHPELPAAIASTGEVAAAQALASFQANLRAHRWGMYRAAMLALARALLSADVGDPRVNVTYAHEIALEMGQLDPDPIWAQLDAECRNRG